MNNKIIQDKILTKALKEPPQTISLFFVNGILNEQN